MPKDITKDKLHAYWTDRLAIAERRLSRSKKEAQWSRWARMANMEDYDRLNFTEPARRDLRLDIVGERPAIKVEAQRAQDAEVEDALIKLCELELDRPENWGAVTRIVDDAGLAGIGWARADWFAEEAAVEEDNGKTEAENVQHAQEHIAALLAGAGAPVMDTDAHRIHAAVEGASLSMFGLTTQQQQAIRAHVQEHEAYLPALVPAGFRLQRVHPGNMLFDDTADDWQYVEWVAERTVERLEDVKDNPLYKNTDRLVGQEEVRRRGYKRRGRRMGLGGSRPPDTAWHSGSFVGAEIKYVVLWHIHDMREDRLIVIAEGNPAEKPLMDEPWPYAASIYFPLVFDRETDGIEGVSDYQRLFYPARQRENIQERWLTHLGQHSRRKVLVEPSFASKDTEAALNDPNRTTVPVEALTGYKVMEDVPINRDAYQVDDRMRENVARAIGVGEPQQGVGGQTGSATEANMLEGTRGKIVKDRRKKVAEMLVWLCRRVLNYYSQFGTSTMLLERGVSPDGDIVLDPSDITEQVTITVDVDALSAAHAELDRQLTRQAVEVFNASPWMIQIVGTQGRAAIAAKFLKSQNILPNPDQVIKLGVAEMKLTQQMMPPEAAVREANGATAGGTVGQQTGNMQTALNSGAQAPGMQQEVV